MSAIQDPIAHIKWVHVDELKSNDWNPNVVMTQEMKLLELNILELGWVQPVLINADNYIIDGFHRCTLSKLSKPLREKYSGLVPCAVLAITEPEAMMLTVRINRAKGTHVAFRMSDLIRRLVDVHKVSYSEIETKIGAYKGEVELLYKENVWERRDTKNHRYSDAWKPRVTK